MPDRILDLTSGLTMVVSDLHGDKDAFARHVGRFLQLHLEAAQLILICVARCCVLLGALQAFYQHFYRDVSLGMH